MSSFRSHGPNNRCSSSSSTRSREGSEEVNENEFETVNWIPFPMGLPRTRTPLITTISEDPWQFHGEIQENNELDSTRVNKKFEGSRIRRLRLSDKKTEAAWNSTTTNPRGGVGVGVVGVRGKAHSEPNSAQTTPARCVHQKVSTSGLVVCTGVRSIREFGTTRGGGGGGGGVAPSVEQVPPHFELVEDSSFWMDHNVQVLIRIRPLCPTEKAYQEGHVRSLKQDSAQSLTWLGNPETRFTFDHVACETISQEKLFDVAGLPMVENCMSGYNSCMFAYGQTGSGKTYTMMGEIHEMDGQLNEDCGMTPRIFEYLFMRIRSEEENRRDEKLRYSCKCSFLEIYNEQITDLLEPSSTNLQIREDMRKGVYVENLTEYEVSTVKDVVELLLQGAANRKMAATHMNSESSRSHSVFTCVIESRWDLDSTTHFRFGRLNLVDLAGSERQKSSGAEGERLKEAANINKSLSTLGLVIMTLVDVAHGKHRHVPYRDSRLTFLLQDSLGGNSKTTIIANISPSTCSAHETLSTLKFAQRAKLIRNNAKVNEDASGDVLALQRQIHQLKDHLTFLLKHQKFSRSLPPGLQHFEQTQLGDLHEKYDSSWDGRIPDYQISTSIPQKKMKCIETTLTGALRREKKAETALRSLEAEIEHMNRLVHQREEDAQRTKMILRFREEKIKRLELFSDGLVSADDYLMEENSALAEEIQLLQARIDRNPELTRFALENIRLIEQLRMFEDFYERGERETLLAEVSELRDQLAEILEGKSEQLEFSATKEIQDRDTAKELEDCRRSLDACLEMNENLAREVDELQRELNKHLNSSEVAFDTVTNSLSGNAETVKQTDKHPSVEMISDRTDFDDGHMQPGETEKELMDARFVIEAMESEQVRLIEELDILRKENLNFQYLHFLRNEDCGLINSAVQHEMHSERSRRCRKTEDPGQPNTNQFMEDKGGNTIPDFESKLDRMHRDLEEARTLNRQYQDDKVSQQFHQNEVEEVRQQVEVEMAKTIFHLQDDLTRLQQELQEKLCCMTQKNMRLRNTIASKEDEINAVSEEWEKATLELTSFLVDGCRSLEDASDQIENISRSFPENELWITEHVERVARSFVEKEQTIEKLRNSLEDAHRMGLELESKLNSLKGATLVITEVQQLEKDENSRETIQLQSLLSEKVSMIQELGSILKTKEDQIIDAERRADAAFVVIKRLSDVANAQGIVPELKMSTFIEQDKYRISEIKSEANEQLLEATGIQVEMARQNILDTENAIYASYADTERHLSSLLSDVLDTASVFPQLLQNLFKDLRAIKKEFMRLKLQNRDFQNYMVMPALSACLSSKPEYQISMVQQIRDQLGDTNMRLNSIGTNLDAVLYVYGSVTVGDSEKIDASSVDCSTSCSDISATDNVPEDLNESLPSTLNSGCPGKVTRRNWDSFSENDSQYIVGDQELKNLKKPIDNLREDATILQLTDEVELAFESFLRIRIQLAKLLKYKEMDNYSHEDGSCFKESLTLGNDSHLHMDHKEGINQQALQEIDQQLQSFELRMEEAGKGCSNTTKMLHLKIDGARSVADEKIKIASIFLNRFEEAQATMKEADAMLNTLLKANENAKYMTDRWKEAGEELKIERDSLIEQVQQLKTFICFQEEEYESLKAQFHSSIVEITNSLVSLEEYFLQMQSDVGQRFNLMYSDILSLGQDLLNCISYSRSSREDIWSKIMENGFTLFVLCQCQKEAYFKKIPQLGPKRIFVQCRQKECHSKLNVMGEGCIKEETSHEEDKSECLEYNLESINSSRKAPDFREELSQSTNDLVCENFSLKKELGRKDILLKGLLFDLSLLQESTSNSKDIKDEAEQMVASLSGIRDELETKTTQLDGILVQHRKLEAQLAGSKDALSVANSKLEQAEKTQDVLSNQNAEMTVLLKDLCAEKNEAEKQLEEKKEIIRSLENEILRLSFSVDKNILSSIEDIEDELKSVTGERDHLREEVISLTHKLDMANALADENEAIAVEARQESEASKMYAEQKEEEAKILEHSVEELDCTINVLEKKVYELGEEVERHRLMRDDLTLELQALRQRMLSVENVTEYMDSEYSNAEQQNDNQISRHKDDPVLELHRAIKQIRDLGKERAEQEKEIKECREYISELILHAEAQATQYQQKYKMLEDMVREVKRDPSTSTSAALTLDKTEKIPRARGSSSPFRCISSLVQQMSVEKDQEELSVARLRIEELEGLASRQQKELCMLNARLAAAESMTHDVIRDLLGVKLDMTNYANLIDQHQVQKLVEDAQQQTEELIAKEQEILQLREQIDDLIEERQSCIEEINQRESDIIAAQLTFEQLRQRDQMLTAQNEMLKMDKTNLKRKMAEMDEMAKKQFGAQSSQQRVLQQTKMKENSIPRIGNEELSKRLTHSEKLLSHVNDEIAWYRKSHSRDHLYNQNDEQRLRNKRQEPEEFE